MRSSCTEGHLGLGHYRLLLVDDDDADAELVTRSLRRQPEFAYTLDRARSLDECLTACRGSQYDVVLLDLNMPGTNGIDTVRAVVTSVSDPAVVVVTGQNDRTLALQALQAGAQDYLVKHHINAHEICRSIRYAAGRKQSQDDLLRLREDFLSHVSHEIRTPLTAAVGALELLQDGDFGPLSETAVHLFEIMGHNLLLLRTMVSDLIDTTMVRSGQLSMYRRAVLPAELIPPIVEAMSPLAHGGGVTLEHRIGDVDPVLADPNRITQVLTNLISNAIKYTRAGGRVTVTVDTESEGRVAFAVADTGVGMPPEVLPHLFDRLYQVPKDGIAVSRRGLGLGLYISQEIVHAHDGEITAASVLGSGSCFSFRLPRASRSLPFSTQDPALTGAHDARAGLPIETRGHNGDDPGGR